MRVLLALCCIATTFVTSAQSAKVHELPEYVYVPTSPDKYTWDRMMNIKGRTIFHNSIACTDSTVFSFGGYGGNTSYLGYCTYRVQREMNTVEGKRLVKDALKYPGKGFMMNVFFIRDSLMYLGGGHDSCDTRYAWNDFWQYNLHTHTWKRLRDLPFYYHRPPYVFTEGGRTVLLISQIDEKDFERATPAFYEYDPLADKWTMISQTLPPDEILLPANCAPKGHYVYPIGFKIEEHVFVLIQSTGGKDNRPGCSSTFYKFSLKTHEWTKLAPFPGWLEAFAFAISDDVYGYIGGGLAYSRAYRKEVYRYDPQKEKWERITNMPEGVIYGNGWRYKGETYVGFGLNDRDNTIAVWKLKHR
jgi:N-acetylneuraminic acid mutarotase